MKTRNHYPILLIALLLGLMGFAERAQADYTLGHYTKVNANGNKIELEWTKTTGSQGTMSLQFRYRVKIRQKGSSEWKEIGPSSDLYCNIIDLYYGTTYEVEVVSEAVYGTGGGSYGVREVTTVSASPTIQLSKSEINMSADGGKETFTIKSIGGWSCSSDPSEAYKGSDRWIDVDISSFYTHDGATVDETNTITIFPNPNKETREAKFIIKSNVDPSVQASISIKQAGKIVPDTEKPKPQGYVDGYPKATSPTEIEVKWNPATDNKTEPSELVYNVGWHEMGTVDYWKYYSENSDPKNWLKNKTEYRIINLKPNTEYELYVSVKDAAGNEKSYDKKYITTPAAAPPIIKLSKNEITIEATTETERFTLTSNCGWERKFEPKEAAAYYSGWIELSPPESSVSTGKTENTEFTMMFAPNKSTTDRTAKIIFTSTEDPSLTATLTVKQKGKVADTPKPTVQVSSILLNLPKVSINGDRESFRLEATVLPADATNSELQWSSSNPNVATVEAASMASLLKAGVTGKAVTVRIHKKGKAEITAQAMDGSGKSASCQVEVLSTVGNIEASEARIYATNGMLHLSLPQPATIQIYNLVGRLVRSVSAPAGDTSVALPQGIYIVRTGAKIEKVVVQ